MVEAISFANESVYLAHWRFLYFHGQHSARLERHKTVYIKPDRERTWLITLLSPLLFLAPEVHLRELEKLWTDEVIIETVWKTFMSKLLEEWGELILWVRHHPPTPKLRSHASIVGIPVDRDAHSERWIPRHTWRHRF